MQAEWQFRFSRRHKSTLEVQRIEIDVWLMKRLKTATPRAPADFQPADEGRDGRVERADLHGDRDADCRNDTLYDGNLARLKLAPDRSGDVAIS